MSAAEAAAESAKEAIAAAQAATYLVNRDFNLATQAPSLDNKLNTSSIDHGFDTLSGNATVYFMPNDLSTVNSQNMDDHQLTHIYDSQWFGRSQATNVNGGNAHRRHSYNTPSVYSDMKFEESDCEESEPFSGIFPPPKQPPPPDPSYHDKQVSAHRVHPKLPDYDTLAARFEALKNRKSLP